MGPTMPDRPVAMITGSTSGLGLAIAKRFAQHGYDLIIHGGNDAEKLKTVVEAFRNDNHNCFGFLADFRDLSSSLEKIESAWNWQNRIDALVNNAGIDLLTEQTTASTAKKSELLWQVDVVATMEISQLIGQKMESIAQGSQETAGNFSITNIGWDQAYQGMAGESGILFSSSKGAIMSMTKSLAQTFAPAVRVNCVAPGWIKTKWAESASPYWQERAKNESLMQRWGTPDDVASATYFLASADASFISGQILNVNGGFRYRQESEENKGE